MTFRGRLTMFFAALVLAPLLAGLAAAHVLAGRQAIHQAESRLQGAELGVEQAHQRVLDAALSALTPDVAKRAFDASPGELHRIRRAHRLGFLYVVRSGRIEAAAMGSPRFQDGYRLTPETIQRTGATSFLPVELHAIRITGPAHGLVVGGGYLDDGFLRGLNLPALIVSHGRVIASTVPHGPTTVQATPFFDVGGGRHGVCVCGPGATSGIAIVTRLGNVGFLPRIPALGIVLLLLGVLVATALAVELARVLSRPHERALVRLEQSERLSLTDALTGVPNRRFLEAALAEETKRATRFGRPFSVLMVDVDRFKSINDTHGHATGDSVLAEVASRIRGELRSDLDIVARYGGEEFTVVLPETDPHGAVVVAERIRGAVGGDALPDGLTVTVSVGVASCPEDGVTAEDLVAAADRALYAAKRGGRDRVVAGRSLV